MKFQFTYFYYLASITYVYNFKTGNLNSYQ